MRYFNCAFVGLCLLFCTPLVAAEAKVVVLYGHPKDPAAFDKYYAETHAPMVRAVKAVKRFEVAKAQPAPNGSPPAFYLVADILFETLEALNATRATDEWKAVAADVPKFATGGFTPIVVVIEPKQ